MKAFKTLLPSLAVLAAAMMPAGASAQNSTVSPYSRFGYGILNDNATSAQSAMGGVGYAMSSGRQINVMNPASYARIDSLTFLFDMGMNLRSQWANETASDGKRLSEKQLTGGLNYITMQFPLSKRVGMSLGVLPYTSVGYDFNNKVDNGYTVRNGQGSINQAYAGLAVRLVGGLSVGANMSYLFGNLQNDIYAVVSSSETSLYQHEMQVRDYRLQGGVQYVQPIGNDRLTLGFTYSPAKDLAGKINTYTYNVVGSNTSEQSSLSATIGSNYALAESYGAGINYAHGDRWMLEADYTYQPWSKVKFNGVAGALANRTKIAVGAQYQPSARGSYLDRIQYRAGAFSTNDYLMVKGNNVREYGASMGLGLPVPGFKSVISVSLGWLHRQATPNPLVKENYLNLTLGVNFNEMWFRKSRIY